jgi:hypothetical protein
MLNSRETTLRADGAYIKLLEAESTWAANYVFSRPNPTQARARPMWADVPGVPGCAVGVANRLLPQSYRVQHRASQNRPQPPPMYGGAPYRALGRGGLKYTDTWSALQQGDREPRRASRALVYDRDSLRLDFAQIPDALRNLPVETRYGQLTRFAPQQLQPHDG